MPVPSLKNSGTEATANSDDFGLCLLITVSIFLFVPTGTVLLQETTVSLLFRFLPIFLATSMTAFRSASPVSFVGVPTAIKTISDSLTLFS